MAKRVPNGFLLLRTLDAEDTIVEELLADLDAGVVRVGKRLQKAAQSNNEEYIEAVAMEGAEYTEAVIGAAFVIAQAYLTRIVSAVIRVAKHPLLTEAGVQLPSGRKSILKLAAPTCSGTAYTLPEAVDAFANYFKHNPEWSYTWTTMERKAFERALPTIKAVRAFGMRRRSHSNMRTGLNRSGVNRVNKLYPALKQWADNVTAQCRMEMKAGGLL